MITRLQTPLAWIWAALFVGSSVAIAAHALMYLSQEFQPANPFHVSFASAGWWVPMHFFGAGFALLVAPLQLSPWLRLRWPALHRIGGWLYVAAVVAGALSGIMLSARAQGGWGTGASFLLLGFVWLAVTGLALWHAIHRRIAEHRRWMLRSVAITFAAVTLRLYLGLGIGVLGLDFATAYRAAAWLCWPVNLLLVEIHLRRLRQTRYRSADGLRSGFDPAGA